MFKRGRPVLEFDFGKAEEMRASGSTFPELAELFGVSKDTVRRALLRCKRLRNGRAKSLMKLPLGNGISPEIHGTEPIGRCANLASPDVSTERGNMDLGGIL